MFVVTVPRSAFTTMLLSPLPFGFRWGGWFTEFPALGVYFVDETLGRDTTHAHLHIRTDIAYERNLLIHRTASCCDEK